jgi:hypothetical protein
MFIPINFQVASLFTLARQSVNDSGVEDFFNLKGEDKRMPASSADGHTEARSELLWFSSAAWNLAMSVWDDAQRMSVSHLWQISSVLWLSAASFFELLCDLPVEGDQSGARVREGQCLMATMMGALGQLEAMDVLSPQMTDEER